VRLLALWSRRSSLGGQIVRCGIPNHDPFLGEYITPDSPLLFDIPDHLLETVEEARVVQ